MTEAILQENLAQVSLSFGIKGITSQAPVFDILMEPRRLTKDASAHFVQVGKVLEACVLANGLPPICVSCDCATSHGTTICFMMGLQGLNVQQEVAGLDFWSQCAFRSLLVKFSFLMCIVRTIHVRTIPAQDGTGRFFDDSFL